MTLHTYLFVLLLFVGVVKSSEEFLTSPTNSLVNVTVSKEPRLLHLVDKLNYPEDTNASIVCSLNSGELEGLSYEWFKDDKRLSPASLNPNKWRILSSSSADNFQSVLRIINLKPEDSAVYSCVAKNSYGQEKISTRLTVKVQLKWISQPRDVEIAVGKPLHVPCTADGLPRPAISWSKVSPDKEQPAQLGPELRFSSVSPQDDGYYECRAGNGAEKDLVARIKLSVLGK